MRRALPRPEFALVGHQESWSKLGDIVAALRGASLPPVPEEDLRAILPWIPPRTVVRSRVASTQPGRAVEGIYVETFITPDELSARSFHRAIEKVREAIACAAREGARIAALGGFTSIVLEGRPDVAEGPPGIVLTTGNTLTAAFIVRGIETAAARLGIDLAAADLLVVGATGDIGSACARYLGRRVRCVLLAARGAERLSRDEKALREGGVAARVVRDVREGLAAADVVICAASLAAPALDLGACRPGALVCDAGYPKNLRPASASSNAPRVFWGGLGQAKGGWQADGTLLETLYSFRAARVAHGCLLEGIVLALARRFEPFSMGRGNITPERMDEIAALAASHGIMPAPLLGPDGVWPEAEAQEPAEVRQA